MTTFWEANEQYTALEAVRRSLRPEPYSYGGKLERLESEVEKLQEFCARLIDALDTRSGMEKDAIAGIIGYGWEAV